MTQLILTHHAKQKMVLYGLDFPEVYGLFINSKKCSVNEHAFKVKHTLNHHQKGNQLYKIDNYILVINQLGVKDFLLVTIYITPTPEMYK